MPAKWYPSYVMEGATSRNAVPGSCLRRIDPAREKNCHATETLDRLMDPEDTRLRPHPTSRLEHGTNQPTGGVSKRTWRRRCSALGAFRIARFSRLELISGVEKCSRNETLKNERIRENAYYRLRSVGAVASWRTDRVAARDVTVASIRRHVAERRHALFVSVPGRSVQSVPANTQREILHLFLWE